MHPEEETNIRFNPFSLCPIPFAVRAQTRRVSFASSQFYMTFSIYTSSSQEETAQICEAERGHRLRLLEATPWHVEFVLGCLAAVAALVFTVGAGQKVDWHA